MGTQKIVNLLNGTDNDNSKFATKKKKKSFRHRFKSNSTNYFYWYNKTTVANTRVVIFYVLEKSKETVLEFSKGTTKVL